MVGCDSDPVSATGALSGSTMSQRRTGAVTAGAMRRPATSPARPATATSAAPPSASGSMRRRGGAEGCRRGVMISRPTESAAPNCAAVAKRSAGTRSRAR